MRNPAVSGWEGVVTRMLFFAAECSAKVRRPVCGNDVGIAGLDGKNVKDGEGEIDDESSEDEDFGGREGGFAFAFLHDVLRRVG
jgi:hypothetical protein